VGVERLEPYEDWHPNFVAADPQAEDHLRGPTERKTGLRPAMLKQPESSSTVVDGSALPVRQEDVLLSACSSSK
jgi:hypothetical protein